MMADDGADDNVDTEGGFLQTGAGAEAQADAGYLRDSADSLSAALGPRWVGRELEADARRKTDALLKGIAGHRALGAFNNLLRAMP